MRFTPKLGLLDEYPEEDDAIDDLTDTFSSLVTDEISLVSHNHGRDRRLQRGITRRELQEAVKCVNPEMTPKCAKCPRCCCIPTRLSLMQRVLWGAGTGERKQRSVLKGNPGGSTRTTGPHTSQTRPVGTRSRRGSPRITALHSVRQITGAWSVALCTWCWSSTIVVRCGRMTFQGKCTCVSHAQPTNHLCEIHFSQTTKPHQ